MAKVNRPQGPDQLTMALCAPGMSLLHRAGLGGLACTLRAIERHREAGTLAKTKLPAAFVDDRPPWDIDEQSITLRFGKPERAGEYLKKLFAFAFAIRSEGIIYLSGQFDVEPSAAVLAAMQGGLTLTFLQHGRVRKLAKEPTTIACDPDGDGIPAISIQYKRCSEFRHQKAWNSFIDTETGCLKGDVITIDGPLSPGTVVRHVAFTSSTAAEDPPSRMLPLCFAPVGCLALPVNRGVAALVVPEVQNLLDFCIDRPLMSPTSVTECQIASAADAALQAQVRLRGRRILSESIPGCYAMTFAPTPWASQQKSRVATIHVPRDEKTMLDRFERALAQLAPRIVTRTVKETVGRGKKKSVIERIEAFRTDSVVRPLIAENLALGRPWYAGFVRLMTRTNPATNKPYRQYLSFERKGLNLMISDGTMWDREGEALVVKAVHVAIRQSLGRIREETDGKQTDGAHRKPPSQATKNRWDRFREKLRLDLAGAKTQAQLRFALADLFSRGGNNSVLRDGWESVLPVIQNDWELARDLSLLALASYGRKEDPASDADDSVEESN